MANNNLFYQLYSNEKNYADVGYTCDSAINEKETSFDITDDKGVITDSNGNKLAEIDLSDIHVSPVTDYTSDTKVLNPGGSLILQGPSTGDSYGNQEFVVPNGSGNGTPATDDNLGYNPDDPTDLNNPENPDYDPNKNPNDPNSDIVDTSNYPYYTNVDFDLNYNGTPVHIDTSNFTRNEENPESIVDIIQNILDCLGVPVSVSLVDSSCPATTSCTCDCDVDSSSDQKVLKFTSNQEGYPFSITNLNMKPVLASTSAPNSPFVDPEITYNDILIMTKTYSDLSVLFFVDKVYSFTEFYKFILNNLQTAMSYFDSSVSSATISAYVFHEIDPDRLKEFYQDLVMMKGYDEHGKYYAKSYSSKQLTCNTVGSKKYPNGAMQGILIVPQYPTAADLSEYKSLKLVHLKDQLNIFTYLDTSTIKVRESSDSNLNVGFNLENTVETIKIDDDLFILNRKTSSSSEGDTNDVESVKLEDDIYLFNRRSTGTPVGTDYGTISKDVSLYVKETLDIETNLNSMNISVDNTSNCKSYCANKCSSSSCAKYLKCVTALDDTTEKIKKINLMKYLQYVTDNDLWINFGQLYAVISNADSDNSDDKNLIPSVFVYNPNTLPMKIKYMVFA